MAPFWSPPFRFRSPDAAKYATSTSSITTCCSSPPTASRRLTWCSLPASRTRARSSIRSPSSGSGTSPTSTTTSSRATSIASRQRCVRIRSCPGAVTMAARKFESALAGGKIVWIDEALTPDSSRFWPAGQYVVGRNPPSYDKQFVRDWLETTGWDKTPPAPELPEDVVMKTREKYIEAYRELTGSDPELFRSDRPDH